MALHAERLAALDGWLLIRRGFALYRRNPARLNFLCVSAWMLLLSVNLMPFVGQVLSQILLPILLVGLLNACRLTEAGQPLAVQVLFSGFTGEVRPLVRLGLVYILISTLVVVGYLLGVAPDLAPLLAGSLKPPVDAEKFDTLIQHIFILINLNMLLCAPVLFAVPLVAWYHLPAGKALFFVLIGLRRNLAPLLVMYLCLLSLGMALPWTVGQLASGLPAGLRQLLPIAILLALMFVFIPTALASFYCAVRAIFRDNHHVDAHA